MSVLVDLLGAGDPVETGVAENLWERLCLCCRRPRPWDAVTAAESQRGESQTLTLGCAGETGKAPGCPPGSGAGRAPLLGTPRNCRAAPLQATQRPAPRPPAAACVSLPRELRRDRSPSLLPSPGALRALSEPEPGTGPSKWDLHPKAVELERLVWSTNGALARVSEKHVSGRTPRMTLLTPAVPLCPCHWSPETRTWAYRAETEPKQRGC